MDIDGDGTDDRELLREFITTAGGRIDNEVTSRGEWIGSGITVDTKFLVVGFIPELADVSDPEENQIVQEISKHRTNLVDEAREQGVRVVNLNDFLSYIGFRQQNRLWRPGEDRPYSLKSGSRGSPTHAPSKSSGQVSGAYSGNDPQQPKSSKSAPAKKFRQGAY